MPVINLNSKALHRRLKICAAELDTTIVDLAERAIMLALEWELFDDLVINAVNSAAKNNGQSVTDFLISSATRDRN